MQTRGRATLGQSEAAVETAIALALATRNRDLISAAAALGVERFG